MSNLLHMRTENLKKKDFSFMFYIQRKALETNMILFYYIYI